MIERKTLIMQAFIGKKISNFEYGMSNFEVKGPWILIYQEHRAQRFHASSFCGSLFNILQFSFQPSHCHRSGKDAPNWDIDLRSLIRAPHLAAGTSSKTRNLTLPRNSTLIWRNIDHLGHLYNHQVPVMITKEFQFRLGINPAQGKRGSCHPRRRRWPTYGLLVRSLS